LLKEREIAVEMQNEEAIFAAEGAIWRCAAPPDGRSRAESAKSGGQCALN